MTGSFLGKVRTRTVRKRKREEEKKRERDKGRVGMKVGKLNSTFPEENTSAAKCSFCGTSCDFYYHSYGSFYCTFTTQRSESASY